MIDLIRIFPRVEDRDSRLPDIWDAKTYGDSFKFINALDALKWVMHLLDSTSVTSFDMDVESYPEAHLPYLDVMGTQPSTDLERITK